MTRLTSTNIPLLPKLLRLNLSMSNSKLPLRPITPKLQELAQDSSIITVVTFPQLEIQEITIPTTNTSIIITTTKVIKKNNRYRVDSYEKETG